MVVEGEANDGCCPECPNPAGYGSTLIRMESANVETIFVSLGGGVQINLSGLAAQTVAATPAQAAQNLVSYISNNEYPFYAAKATGNLVRIFWLKSTLDGQACDEGTPIINVSAQDATPHTVLEPLNCCGADLPPGEEPAAQSVVTEIIQQITCCPGWLVSARLRPCCCDDEETLDLPQGFDLSQAIECVSVGRIDGPPVEFFQNWRIDPDLIPLDCFIIELFDSAGNNFLTECYRKESGCETTVEICGVFKNGTKDCDGNYYGELDWACPEGECPFQNCIRIPGEFQDYGEYVMESENDGRRRRREKRFRLRAGLLPPQIVERLTTIFMAETLTINGMEATPDENYSITQNIQSGRMTTIDQFFTVDTCEINDGCEDANITE